MTGVPVEVVVVGGGYAAVWGTRALVRGLRREIAAGAVRVTVVSESTHHAFHGWTGEVVTGHVRAERALTPLAALLRGVRLVRGTVVELDRAGHRVVVETPDGPLALPYDHVLVAVGSRDARERVPGLAQHGWSLKDTGGLEALCGRLRDVVGQAAEVAAAGPAGSDEARRLLTVVVAGGGFAGTEAAAAVARRLAADAAARQSLAGIRPRVLLAHGGSDLLAELRPRYARLADYAVARAAEAGVELRLSTRVTEVTPEGVRLVHDGVPAWVPAGSVVSAVGQAPVVVPGTEDLERDANGRLVTDAMLRTADPAVWAAGDAAAVPRPGATGVCPPNALWAIEAGAHAGRSIARVVRGREPRPFRFPGLGQAASLGLGQGAAELYGVQLTGRAGWVARWLFFHWFMPSRRQALATVVEWFRRPVEGPAERPSVAATWNDAVEAGGSRAAPGR